MNPIAESWELSAHKDGQSIVATGEHKGLFLTEYIEKCGNEILGTNAKGFDKFPILIKLIDAKDKLSIQVHPSDEYALANEGEYGMLYRQSTVPPFISGLTAKSVRTNTVNELKTILSPKF